MKKLLIVIVSFLIMFCVAGLAQAREHKIVKGECLSGIALQYGLKSKDLKAANPEQIKNPDLIYAGRVLTIPTTTAVVKKQKQVVIVVGEEVEFTPLNSLGQHAFGSKRDGIKAIKMFSLPEEVKALLIAKVRQGEFEWSFIRKGDRFSEMVFGNYKIVKNKIANWDAAWLEAARLYKVELEGKMYLLFDPLKCRNWAWRAEIEEVIKPSAEKPPEVVVKPEEPKKLMMLLIPVKEEPEKAIVEVKAEIPPSIPLGCSPEWESYGWLGHYWALEGGGQSNYYGGKANIFFCPHETSFGRMREGVGFTINGWDGDNSGYNFRGNRWSVGPVVDLITKSGSRFTTTLQLGRQDESGHDGLGYEAGQRTNILYFGQTADFYNINKYVFKSENWLDVNIDIGHEKDSSWGGFKISGANDPAENKTNVSFGSRGYFWQTEKFRGGVMAKGTYAFGDHMIGLEAGPFISDKEDIIKAGVGWRYQFNSAYENNNGHLIGIGLDLDIVKTIDKIVRYLKTKEKKEERL